LIHRKFAAGRLARMICTRREPGVTMNRTATPSETAAPTAACDALVPLDACHRRTLAVVAELRALPSAIDHGGVTPAVRAAAASIANFLSATARVHHEDEERQVFPPLLASGDAALVDTVRRLQQDHGWLEENWRELEPQLRAIATNCGSWDIDTVSSAIGVLSDLYREHIELEESIAYPEARARLAPATRPRRTETRMTTPHATLRIIREEHGALAAMLGSILLLLAQHRRRGSLPDFTALRAMLFYVDEFPEQRHHRKESELLFPKLRARTPQSRALLDRLDAEHARGEHAIRELEHALLGFEMLGETRRLAFEQAAQRYVDFYLAHMRLEEEEILPLAERVLSDADWVELDAAFTANRDPFTGHAPEAPYEALFSRIVNLVPAPIGLGEAK
jgi:hemerythrin-like domain-containing protein